jgi:hypothetical protein
MLSLIHSREIQNFGKADSLLRDGRSKSFLPLVPSNFSLANACD